MITKEKLKKHIEFHNHIYDEVISLGEQLHGIWPEKYSLPYDKDACILMFDDERGECNIIDDSFGEEHGELIFSIPYNWLSMPVEEVKEIVKNNRLNFIKNYALNNSKDIDPEFNDIVNDNFYDLI